MFIVFALLKIGVVAPIFLTAFLAVYLPLYKLFRLLAKRRR
ncbi:hypothetical protein [Hugenholtzia roseola]|nr:hypothetical protein [Hugenholtzia roseola]